MSDNKRLGVSLPIMFFEEKVDIDYGKNLYWAIDDNPLGLEGINIFPDAKGGGRLFLTFGEGKGGLEDFVEGTA
tara:strand:+ start:2148 stop:2369 length:222 start_codon:yes stop_codon:yes gene_type:complete